MSKKNLRSRTHSKCHLLMAFFQSIFPFFKPLFLGFQINRFIPEITFVFKTPLQNPMFKHILGESKFWGGVQCEGESQQASDRAKEKTMEKKRGTKTRKWVIVGGQELRFFRLDLCIRFGKIIEKVLIDSFRAHGRVAQLVRVLARHARGNRFKSCRAHHAAVAQK